jgi:membrane protein required for colicin V production
MNWLDAVIAISFIYLTYTGFTAGLLREAIVLMAAIVGVTIAGLFYDELAGDINNFIDSEEGSLRLAYFSLIGAVVIAGMTLSFAIKTSLAVFYLGSFDSVGGAVCGAAKALVLIQAVLIGFVTFPGDNLLDAVEDSFIGSNMLDSFAFLLPLLPAAFDNAVNAI